MKLYGIIGHPLKHSQSKDIFDSKFKYEQLDCRYQNFDLKSIEELPHVIESHPDLCGFSVTIPYKEAVLPYLDEVDATAQAIGAVNAVKVRDGKLTGYNTDVYGFNIMLERILNGRTVGQALVLGTGGASKAVRYVLEQRGIPYHTVSRKSGQGDFTYDTLSDQDLKEHLLIVNTTPVGMYPHNSDFPEINYQALSNKHFLVDLIYNPKETSFMKLGKTWGAKAYNGMQMLEEQAKKAWDIWNE